MITLARLLREKFTTILTIFPPTNFKRIMYYFYIFLLKYFFCMIFVIVELYEYCLKEGYADKNLIAKWKKQGYENLCCLRCIQCRDTNFGTNCICRVPKAKLEEVSSCFCYLL